MLGTYVAPVLTRYSLEDLEYALRVGLTQKLGKRPSDESVAVCMAKCRLEIGNGEHCWNHDLGNIKQHPDALGNYTCIVLNEVLPNQGVVYFAPGGRMDKTPRLGGKIVSELSEVPPGHPQTRMAARSGPTDAGYFYIDFLFSLRRYEGATQAMLAGNPEAFVRELKKGGYFTAPLEAYLTTVMRLYAPSLAVVRKQHVEQPFQPSRDEWHNQLVLDGFIAKETERLLDEGPRAGRNVLDYEAGDE